MQSIVGWTLVAGLVVFMVGAVAWRLDYEQPLRAALRVIHRDRRRRAWIHLWMIAAMFITAAGLSGLTVALPAGTSTSLAAMSATVYGLGAVCWVASLAFRLTVVPWAAERTATHDTIPEGFAALDQWATSLYAIHMAAAYVSFVVLGVAVLHAELPTWLGWLGVGWGTVFAVGFAATRAAGPFNPPFWAHTYTAVVGVTILAT